jgi:hypothetical protein
MYARSAMVAARGASRAVSRGPSSFLKPAVGIMTRASFSSSGKLLRDDGLTKESYTKGSVPRATTAVGEGEAVAQEPMETVVPLSRAVYNSMTPSMKKMTLMDKVVVVTGYVFFLYMFARQHLKNKQAKAD